MRKVLLTLLMMSVAGATLAEETDPIDRIVPDSALSSAYAGNEKSDFMTNKEFKITVPKGNAQDAIGSQFTRGAEDFEVVSIRDRDSTYDHIRSASYDRVIYLAKKLEIPDAPPPPRRPIGRQVLVAVDYRPVKIPPPPVPPPPTPEVQYEAYMAEVKLGVEDTPRWEFSKVKSN